MYIYCSNESKLDVFFDNLQVVHTTGALLEETHYYPFGLTMNGISSNALKQGYPQNKKKYNGIEYESSFDLNIGETFFRSHDPQIGRWLQIDPKPTEMFSSYAAMNNNPIVLSDPLGDTTWVYNQNGFLLGVVPDNMRNEVHFRETSGDPGKPFNTRGLTKKQINDYGKHFRETSKAFIGSKTLTTMRKIINESVKARKEVGFVGTVGKDKEILLKSFPIDERNQINQTPLIQQIDENYPAKAEQAKIFLSGHTHIKAFVEGWSPVDRSAMSQLKAFGTPNNVSDYMYTLYRSSNATEKGQAPGIILTPYGAVIYSEGFAFPINHSYILYKGLK